MKTFIFCLFFFVPFFGFAQIDPLSGDSIAEIYETIEEGASPLEGFGAFKINLTNRLQIPAEAKKLKVEGKVFIQFIVDEEGNLAEFMVVRGLGSGWDEEVLRVFQAYDKKWKAGKLRGKNAKQRIVVPLLCEIR